MPLASLVGCSSDTPKSLVPDASAYYNDKYGSDAHVESCRYIQEDDFGVYDTDDAVFMMSDGRVVLYNGQHETFSDNRQADEIDNALNSNLWLPAIENLRECNGVSRAEFSQTFDNGAEELRKKSQGRVLFNFVSTAYDDTFGSFYTTCYDGDIQTFAEQEHLTLSLVDVVIYLDDCDDKRDGAWYAGKAEASTWYKAAKSFADEVSGWIGGDGYYDSVDIRVMLDGWQPDEENHYCESPFDESGGRAQIVADCRIEESPEWVFYSYYGLGEDIEYSFAFDSGANIPEGISLTELGSEEKSELANSLYEMLLAEMGDDVPGLSEAWNAYEDCLLADDMRICKPTFTDEARQKGRDESSGMFVFRTRYREDVVLDDAMRYCQVGGGCGWQATSIAYDDGSRDTQLVMMGEDEYILECPLGIYDTMVTAIENIEAIIRRQG